MTAVILNLPPDISPEDLAEAIIAEKPPEWVGDLIGHLMTNQIHLEPVESSNIQSMGYHPPTGNLFVKFASGLYVYRGVPQEVHQGLLDAPSKGSYLNDWIKGSYSYEKISD